MADASRNFPDARTARTAAANVADIFSGPGYVGLRVVAAANVPHSHAGIVPVAGEHARGLVPAGGRSGSGQTRPCRGGCGWGVLAQVLLVALALYAASDVLLLHLQPVTTALARVSRATTLGARLGLTEVDGVPATPKEKAAARKAESQRVHAQLVAAGVDVQAALHAQQFPANCSTVNFVKAWVNPILGGWGSRQVYYRACLTQAYLSKRTLVLESCFLFDCQFILPWSSCTPEDVAAADANSARPGAVANCRHYGSKHGSFTGHSESYATPPAYAAAPFGLWWWHAQVQTFLTRPTAAFLQSIAARKTTLGWGGDVVHVPGMHVRRGDKVTEVDSLPSEAYLRWARWVAPCADKWFLATDSEYTLAEMMKCPEWAGLPVLDNRPGNFHRQDVKTMDAALFEAALVDVFLLSQSDPLVVTFSSNMGYVAAGLKLARDGGASNILALDNFFWYPIPTVFNWLVPQNETAGANASIATAALFHPPPAGPPLLRYLVDSLADGGLPTVRVYDEEDKRGCDRLDNSARYNRKCPADSRMGAMLLLAGAEHPGSYCAGGGTQFMGELDKLPLFRPD
jgi:hypothetical protein